MSLDVQKLLPVDIDGQKVWIARNWSDSDEFADAKTVRVAFRTLQSMKREHWLNRFAALATARSGERSPGGKMCHAEVIFPVSNGKYVKASVIKKSFDGLDEKGKPKFKPGHVHLELTSPSEWKKKYVFIQMSAPRHHIKKMMNFFLINNKQPFNHRGYLANLVIPGGIGVKQYSERLSKVPRAYFCTEFIVTGIQCLASADDREVKDDHWKKAIFSINPATSNPNMLYRVLKGSSGVFDDVALGRIIELV